MVAFTYDEQAMVYLDAHGRVVPDADVRAAVDQVTRKTADLLAGITAAMLAGSMTREAWQGEFSGLLKLSNVAVGMIGHGGRQAVGSADLGDLGILVRRQFSWLQGFAAQLARDAAGTEKQIVARARQYAKSAELTFQHVKGKVAIALGFDQELNVSGSEQPCVECPRLSALGWVAAGTLPPVGSRSCGSRCACEIRRRRSAQRIQEAA